MKKLPILFVGLLAAASLAACGNNGDSSAVPTTSPTSAPTSAPTSESTTSPTPEKTAWSPEEQELIEEVLGEGVELPFAKELTISEELSYSAIIAEGTAATASDVEAYGVALEAKGYVADEYVPEDLAELYVFGDDVMVFRLIESRANYVPTYGQVIAVGLSDEGSKLAICATYFYCCLDADFSESSMGYQGAGLENLQECLSFWIAAAYAPEEATQEEVEARAAKFPYFASTSCSFVGLDDDAYMSPFTYGNIYSDDFGASGTFYIAGIQESDHSAYVSALLNDNYEVFEEEDYFDVYGLEEEEGIYMVILSEFDENFWQGDEDTSGCFFAFGFVPAEEE